MCFAACAIGLHYTLVILEDAFAKKLSLLKCNAMSAPFERAFDDQLAGRSSPGFMVVHYRGDQEAIYVKADNDRVTVIFSTLFSDETDKVFGKVFLQVCRCISVTLTLVA